MRGSLEEPSDVYARIRARALKVSDIDAEGFDACVRGAVEFPDGEHRRTTPATWDDRISAAKEVGAWLEETSPSAYLARAGGDHELAILDMAADRYFGE